MRASSNIPRAVYREGYVKLGHVAFLDFASMLKAAPALAKLSGLALGLFDGVQLVKNEKLRQALSFHTLLVGGNPMTTSAIYALIHKLERDGGVWWAEGGTNTARRRHGPPFRAAGRRPAAGRSGDLDRHAGRPRHRRAHRERLEMRSMRSRATPTSSTAIAICSRVRARQRTATS
jgi:hypothetical protein